MAALTGDNARAERLYVEALNPAVEAVPPARNRRHGVAGNSAKLRSESAITTGLKNITATRS